MNEGMSGRQIRIVDIISLLVVAIFIAWLAIPSSVFFRPEAIVHDGMRVTLVRHVPFGEVDVYWSRQLYVAGTNLECHAPDRIERVRQIEGRLDGETKRPVGENAVVWITGEWSVPCLEADPPIIRTDTWRVLLLGIIPLRPVSLTTTINTSLVVGSTGCPAIRGSTTGFYHEHGVSPWYDRVVVTTPSRCFATPEEAEAAGYRRAGGGTE